LLWDDGRAKSPEERLNEPDLEDALRLSYDSGAISPVTAPDHDPGRVRPLPLFDALYGANAAAVTSALAPWSLFGHTHRVHRRALPAFEAVARRLETLVQSDPALRVWLEPLGGTFVWRSVAGTERRSAHAWGIAVDLNPARCEYWRDAAPGAAWRNRVPEVIVRAFEAEGFIWGGRWRHFDTMHFEYRPELLDPECVASSEPVTAPPAASSSSSPPLASAQPSYPWLRAAPAEGSRLESRVPAPPGFARVPVSAGTFGAFLRGLPLLPPASRVLSHRGEVILAADDPRLTAVVDLDIGARDLQQCADTVIRLHAEWAYSHHGIIRYQAGDGTRFDFERYLSGERVVPRGARLVAVPGGQRRTRDHAALRAFLDDVFSWVNTGALARQARPVPIAELAVGDFFVMGGNPFGHAVIVLDIAENAQRERRLLLGQGYMPAQHLHVLRSPSGEAWFPLDLASGYIETPFWRPFPFATLRRL
jgi:hypothetical protein